MRTLLLGFLLPGLLLLGGCASSGRSFRAVGASGDLVGEAEYLIESKSGLEGSLRFRLRGYRDEKVGERVVDTVAITVKVSNESEDEIALPVAEMKARDDAGHQLVLLEKHLPEEIAASEVLRIPGKTRTSFDLVFDAGGEDSLQAIGSVTLDWVYDFRGVRRAHATRFLPVRYVYRRYYGRPFLSFGFWGRPCW